MRKFCFALLTIGMGQCLARSVDPYSGYCRILDRVTFIASRLDTRSSALDLLELVAMNRTSSIKSEIAVHVGLEQGQLQQPGFSSAEVRVCAFKNIGETGLEEALEFLSNLKKADIGKDTTGSIWPAAQTALANARLNKLVDPFQKIKFLEDLAVPRTLVSYWAVEQLCNLGSVGSISVTRAYFKALHTRNEFYGEDQREFCETRMKVISGNPDRVQALGSVLRVPNTGPDSGKLIHWAVDQLASMDTPAAETELRRFQRETKVPSEATSREMPVSDLSEWIDSRLEHNRLRKIPLRQEPRSNK